MTTTASGKPARQRRPKNWSLFSTLQVICGRTGFEFPLVLPDVHPVAGPFLIWRLKRKGFSNCRVVEKSTGLHVYADR